MRSYTNLRGAFRATGANLPFYPKGRTALTTCEAGGGIPSRWSGSCALHELSIGHFSREGRKCRKSAFPVQSALLLMQRLLLVAPTGYSARLLPAKTCHRQLYHRYGQQCSPFSLYKRETETKGVTPYHPLTKYESR